MLHFGKFLAEKIDPELSQKEQFEWMMRQVQIKAFLKEKLNFPIISLSGSRRPHIALPIARVLPPILFSIGILAGAYGLIRRESVAAASVGIVFSLVGVILYAEGGLL